MARATSSRGASSSTNRWPPAPSRVAPSPRTASVTRNPSRGPSDTSAVGWNCTKSRSASSAPAACASAKPTPVDPRGLVVRAHSAAAPPVARTVARETTRSAAPSRSADTPTQRPPETSSAVAVVCSITSMRSWVAAVADSWRVMRRPVAAPPACTIRRAECPPSRPSASAPRRSASKRTPSPAARPPARAIPRRAPRPRWAARRPCRPSGCRRRERRGSHRRQALLRCRPVPSSWPTRAAATATRAPPARRPSPPPGRRRGPPLPRPPRSHRRGAVWRLRYPLNRGYGNAIGAPLLFRHEASLHHDTGAHPERADRIRAIEALLEQREWLGYEPREAPRAELEQILRVHPESYVESVRDHCERGAALRPGHPHQRGLLGGRAARRGGGVRAGGGPGRRPGADGLLRPAPARPSRRARAGDGLLPVRQRGHRRAPRPRRARLRARAGPGLGRASRQRHAGDLRRLRPRSCS